MIAINGCYQVTQQLDKYSPQETIEDADTQTVTCNTKTTDLLVPVSVKLGKTISLQDMESARVNVGITLFTTDSNVDENYNKALQFVREWLNFEAACVKGNIKDRPAFVVATDCTLADIALVTIEYGVTLNMGQFKFSKADVARTIPAKLSDLPAEVKRLEDWTEVRIAERIEAIKYAFKTKG